MTNNRLIYLYKNATENIALSDEGFLVYVALRAKWYISNHHFVEDIVYYEQLLWILYGNDTFTKGYIEKVKNGLNHLNTLGLINIINSDKEKAIIHFNDCYFLNSPKAEKEGLFCGYTVINLGEVHSIMNSAEKYRDKMLRYFVAKIGSIYHGEPKRPHAGNKGYYCMNNVGCMPINYCATIAQIKEKAAIHYERWFEENGLLIILRSSNKIVDDYSRRIVNGFSNCYARPEHAVDLKQYYEQREKYIGNLKVVRLTEYANKRRRIKQSYNAFLKGKGCNPMDVVLYLNERIINLKKVNVTLFFNGDIDSLECYYSSLEEIDEYSCVISELLWQMFLDDELDLQEV